MTEQREPTATGRAPVRIVYDPDPHARAVALASELDGDVAADLAAAEREVRIRVEAGRRALSSDGSTDTEVLARAPAIRAAAGEPPPISDDDVRELQRLASDLARAGRIRVRTETRFNENLQAKLAASTGMALHPAAIRAAATAVVEADAALRDAEEALARLGPRPLPAAAPEAAFRDAAEMPPEPVPAGHDHIDPVLQQPVDDFDEHALDRRRAVTRGLAAFIILLGLASIALGVGQPPAVSIGLAAAGVVLGLLIVIRGRRKAAHHAHGLAEGAAMLASLEPRPGRPETPSEPAPAADLTPEPSSPSIPAAAVDASAPEQDPWLDERVRLDAARDEAEELARAARNRWRQLAGADADPTDADAIVRAHDPQLAYDPQVAEASPTVRTVAAFHRKAHARWRVLWASLGREDAPEPEDLDAFLDEQLRGYRQAQAELRQLEQAEVRAAARTIVARPLILVGPSRWVEPTRLGQLLSSIPPSGQVVLVEREGETLGLAASA